MGDEHGRKVPAPFYPCEEPSAAAGPDSCAWPPRADKGNADGSGATFQERILYDRSLTTDSVVAGHSLMFMAFAWTADRIAAIGAGLALLVFLYVFFFGKRRVVAQPPPIGPQEVTIIVLGGYRPDTVVAKKGMLLKLVFDRRESNPCSDEVVLPEFGIRQPLPANQKTVIAVTPEREGEFPFSCGMNMLHGKIKVVP